MCALPLDTESRVEERNGNQRESNGVSKRRQLNQNLFSDVIVNKVNRLLIVDDMIVKPNQTREEQHDYY